MGSATYTAGSRRNYKGGNYNKGGSQLIGWDSGKVRSERYTFKTGQWPVSKLSFTFHTSVTAGKNIAIRCAISTSGSANVNKSGSSGGYAVTKNGTTTITTSLKANTTYYIVFYPGVSKSNYGLLKPTDSTFKIHATVIDRTACTAPTNLILARTIQTPGELVQLSWSGAASGTNTQIASYEVFYSTNKDAPDSEWTSAGSTTDASTTFNVTTPAARQTYYYKVKTKSDPEGYDSPLSIASGGLTGNVIPEVPIIQSIVPAAAVVPSTGGEIKFKVTPGSVYQGTATLYYSTSLSSEKIQFDEYLTITVTQNITFSFFTYDGTDYSTATTQAITLNDKPQITKVTASSINAYTALGGDGISGSQLGYVNELNPVISTSEAGKISIFLEYYSSDDTNTWDNTETITSVPLVENFNISSAVSDLTLEKCHVHKGISLGSENIHWRLKLILNDGIENSNPAYFPNNNGTYEGKYYAIAHAPSLIAKYNQFSNSDITGTTSGQIGDEIRLKIYKDTSMTGEIEVVARVGNEVINVKALSSSYDGLYQYIDITLDDTKLNSDAQIGITTNLTDSDGCLKKAISGIGTVIETKKPYLPYAVASSMKTIKPFTTTSTFGVTVGWPFGDYESLAAALAAYNCAASGAIKLVYSNDTSGSSKIEKIGLTWSKNSSTLETTVDSSTVYTWNNALGYDVYAGKHKYYCRLEITNLFGKVYATPWLDDDSAIFDFDEKAKDLEIKKIEWQDGTDWTELTSSQTIQKGMTLRFTCYFELYTTDEVKVSILVSSNSLVERDPGFYDSAKGATPKTPITYTDQELTRADSSNPRTAGQNTRYYIYTVDTDISSTDTRHWKLKITNNAGEEESSVAKSKDTEVLRQCEPTINFTTCKVAKDYRITYYFEVTDNGGAAGQTQTFAYYLSDQNPDHDVSVSVPSAQTTTTNPFPVTGWESKNIYIKVVSTVTGLITHSETYYSKPILAYQITPTVAYRPNTLGVNVENPDATAMVDIRQASGKSIVLVQGRDSGSNPTKFVMNPTTGAIQFYGWDSTIGTEGDYVLKSTLDLLNGQITIPSSQ